MKLKSLVFAAVAAVFMAGSAWAHHSHANYNTNDITQLEGTVKELRWMNPHTWIYLEVVQNGKPALWVLEGGSPSGVGREGMEERRRRARRGPQSEVQSPERRIQGLFGRDDVIQEADRHRVLDRFHGWCIVPGGGSHGTIFCAVGLFFSVAQPFTAGSAFPCPASPL